MGAEKKTYTNQEVIKMLLEDGANPVLEQALKAIDTNDNNQIIKLLENSPSTKNEFIQTLVNRFVKTRFFSKVYHNPLKMFHNGKLEYGDTIQDIFVKFGTKKGFKEHFTKQDGSNGTEESDLISKKVPDVVVKYLKQNFEYTYKVSIGEEDLRKAFMNSNGLQTMVAQLINNNLSTAERNEYKDMVKILSNDVVDDGTGGSRLGKGIIQDVFENSAKNKTAIIRLGKSFTPQVVCETVREYAKEFTFPSSDYNLADVETWSESDELVFLTNANISAKIDVNVLAQAFNVSSADVNVRSVVVDKLALPTVKGEKVLGILMDKWLIQAWDTVYTSGLINIPTGMYSNHFLQQQGIRTRCDFAQILIITDGTPTQA